MAERKCDWCGAENPRWLKHVDQSVIDYGYRKMYGMPGPTSKAYHACDDCKLKLDVSFPPDMGLAESLAHELEPDLRADHGKQER